MKDVHGTFRNLIGPTDEQVQAVNVAIRALGHGFKLIKAAKPLPASLLQSRKTAVQKTSASKG
jgi:hypothetical protein